MGTLLEVMTHWTVLRSLIAAEIAYNFAEPEEVEGICNMLVSSMITRCSQSSSPDPAAASSAAASTDAPERHAQPARKPRGKGAAAAKDASKDDHSRDSAWDSWNNG